MPRIKSLRSRLGKASLSELYGLANLDRMPKIAMPTAELQTLLRYRLMAVLAEAWFRWWRPARTRSVPNCSSRALKSRKSVGDSNPAQLFDVPCRDFR